MANGTTTPTLAAQLWALFLANEKTAVLPDVIALFNSIGQNGVSLMGLPLLVKAFTAVEADAIVGGQNFLKQAAGVLSTYLTTAITPAA